MKEERSVVIHASDRFTGKNSRPVTQSAEDITLSYSIQISAALNAWLATCLAVVSIPSSQPSSSEKTDLNGLNQNYREQDR